MSDKRVLITGISGLIGGILRKSLSDTYVVSGVDRRPVPDVDVTVADTTELDAVRPAFEDVDTVIDLAAVPDMDTSWEVVLSRAATS